MLKIKNYSSKILTDISLEIESNSVILGENGAGKTTLAKVFSGIIPSLEVTVDGINPSTTFGEKKTKLINYVPPKLEIFDEYITVFEFLSLSTLYSKLQITKVLELLFIENLKNKPCKILSSGESQLVLFASALLHKARYTILDEPTSNLDPIRTKIIYKLLLESSLLKKKILITHDLNLAFKLGFDIIYIKDKKVDFHGENKEFFNQKNLDKYFQNSVRTKDGFIVVDL